MISAGTWYHHGLSLGMLTFVVGSRWYLAGFSTAELLDSHSHTVLWRWVIESSSHSKRGKWVPPPGGGYQHLCGFPDSCHRHVPLRIWQMHWWEITWRMLGSLLRGSFSSSILAASRFLAACNIFFFFLVLLAQWNCRKLWASASCFDFLFCSDIPKVPQMEKASWVLRTHFRMLYFPPALPVMAAQPPITWFYFWSSFYSFAQ